MKGILINPTDCERGFSGMLLMGMLALKKDKELREGLLTCNDPIVAEQLLKEAYADEDIVQCARWTLQGIFSIINAEGTVVKLEGILQGGPVIDEGGSSGSMVIN